METTLPGMVAPIPVLLRTAACRAARLMTFARRLTLTARLKLMDTKIGPLKLGFSGPMMVGQIFNTFFYFRTAVPNSMTRK